MATETRYPTKTTGADVDVVAGISIDRLYLRVSFSVQPCVYVHEADGITRKKNAAGNDLVEPVGNAFAFFLSLPKAFELATAAEKLVRDSVIPHTIDNAHAVTLDKFKQDAFAAWDALVAAHKADPANVPAPTVQQLAEQIGCEVIQGDHPFTL